MSIIKKYGFILSLIFVDQFTKLLARRGNINFDLNFLNFSLAYNKGVSFGFFDNFTPFYLVLALNISALFLIRRFLNSNDVFQEFGKNLLITGAISNLIDRVFAGKVTDFINFLDLTIFNLADLYITIGVLIYIFRVVIIFFTNHTIQKGQNEISR